MIHRDPAAAGSAAFDLIVVGGGVYGIATTLEAARRGLTPLLLERGDFGGETSWNSLRIVHGGLRYLQRLDLARFSESVLERRWWLAHFPDLVFPLPCLLPLNGRGLRRPWILRAALGVNDLLSPHRNAGVRADRMLPAGKILPALETHRIAPSVPTERLLGGALWHDAFMPESQRVLIEMIRWATACGAVVLNYVDATRLLAGRKAVRGVEASDRESGERLRFEAPVVINCAGPWNREVASSFDRDVPELFHHSLAFNALLDHEPLSEAALAVAPPGRGGRTYFLVPWKGRLFAGTYHAPWPGTLRRARIEDRLVEDFLTDLRAALPALKTGRRDVLRIHWGFLPARRPGSMALADRAVIHDHSRSGGPRGLFSVSGIKFTTARAVAEKTLQLAFRSVMREELPAIGGQRRPRAAAWSSRPEMEDLLNRAPGEAADQIRRLIAQESVVRPEDLLLRRTDWGIDPREAEAVERAVAQLSVWGARRDSSSVEPSDS